MPAAALPAAAAGAGASGPWRPHRWRRRWSSHERRAQRLDALLGLLAALLRLGLRRLLVFGRQQQLLHAHLRLALRHEARERREELHLLDALLRLLGLLLILLLLGVLLLLDALGEQHHDAARVLAPRPAEALDLARRRGGRVEADDQVDLADVEPLLTDRRRDEKVYLPRLELRDHLALPRLVHAAVVLAPAVGLPDEERRPHAFDLLEPPH